MKSDKPIRIDKARRTQHAAGLEMGSHPLTGGRVGVVAVSNAERQAENEAKPEGTDATEGCVGEVGRAKGPGPLAKERSWRGTSFSLYTDRTAANLWHQSGTRLTLHPSPPTGQSPYPFISKRVKWSG